MTFIFKIFKALTSINLVFSGISLLIVVFWILAGYVPLLLLGIFVGGLFMHTLLSVALQKNLQDATVPMKESTPSGILLMGGLSLVLAGLFIAGIIETIGQRQEKIAELMVQVKEMPAEQRKQFTVGAVNATINAVLIFFGLFSAMIITNVLLSFRFLKQWKDRQEPTEPES